MELALGISWAEPRMLVIRHLPCYESQAALFPPLHTARGHGRFGGKREVSRWIVLAVTSKSGWICPQGGSGSMIPVLSSMTQQQRQKHAGF